MKNSNEGITLKAAAQWKQLLIEFDGTILGQKKCWSKTFISDLRHRFESNILEDKERSFQEKLHEQIGSATPETIMLAAEILWALYLFPSNIGPEKKVSNISTVWRWSSDSLDLAQGLLKTDILSGIGSGGPGYNNHFWREFLFALIMLDELACFSVEERKKLLEDPDSFARWIDALPSSENRQFRHMLLYLFFPSHYERISSRREKNQILTAFGKTPDPEENDSRLSIDIALRKLRSQLVKEQKNDKLDFYDAEIKPRWRQSKNPSDSDPQKGSVSIPPDVFNDISTGMQYWLVGASWESIDKTEEFIEAGIWRNGYEEKYLDLVRSVRIGDRIIIKASFRQKKNLPFDNKGHDIGIMRIKARGVVTENPGDGRRLVVQWEDDFEPFDLYGYVWQPTIALINSDKWPHVIGWLFYNEKQPIDVLAATWYAESKNPSTPAKLGDSATVLPLSFDYHHTPINRVYYGPPGTGKTYKLIQENGIERMPEYRQKDMDGKDCLVVVSFHQSYSYEDFIEGLRPIVINNNVEYRVKTGIFKDLCERAIQNPERKFAIFIDEINRGNVSAIFGELITLIESDKRLQFIENGEPDYSIPGTAVSLPYSPDPFGIPCNVDIYATMNTADRSLVRIDTALRRRFEFVECLPLPECLKGIVIDGIDIEKMLIAINDRIEAALDRDHTIGHAYFMNLKGKSTLKDLSLVFERKILPLLEEYFFDDWAKISEILNDPSKPKDAQIIQNNSIESSDEYKKTRYQKNIAALINPQAYIGIYE